MLEKQLLLRLCSVLFASALFAACGEVPAPAAPTLNATAPATTVPVPTVDLNDLRTQSARDVFATLTASAPTLPVISPSPTTTVAGATKLPPTKTLLPPPTRTRIPPTLTFTPAPPTPTPPRLLAANLGGGGDLKGRLLYPDTGGPVPTYTKQFYFEVTANDPRAGDGNGQGIDSVQFTIFDDQGTTVFQHTETNPRYCSFGGNEPCNWFVFAKNGLKWPDSDQKIQGVDLHLRNTNYQLNATVHGTNGDELFGQLDFVIRCNDCSN